MGEPQEDEEVSEGSVEKVTFAAASRGRSWGWW